MATAIAIGARIIAKANAIQAKLSTIVIGKTSLRYFIVSLNIFFMLPILTRYIAEQSIMKTLKNQFIISASVCLAQKPTKKFAAPMTIAAASAMKVAFSSQMRFVK